MSEAKCPECDLAQHRGDCFDDEIDARLSKSLRAEGERLRAHGGGSITYVERCDSCETFRQRMIAEKARAEKAERERVIEWALGERGDFPSLPDDWPKRKFYWRTELRERAFGKSKAKVSQ